MRLALPVLAILVAALFAGCAATQATPTAKSAYSTARQTASAWASDSVLVTVGGLELVGGELPKGADSSPDVQAFAQAAQRDTTPGDGQSPAWGAIFFSQEKSAVYLVFVIDGSVSNSIEQKVPAASFSANVVEGLRTFESSWSVDSTAAIQAVRDSNTTFDTFVSSATQVSYELDASKQRWEIEAKQGNVTYSALVDPVNAAVKQLKKITSGGIGPIGPSTPPAPKPRIPPPAIYDNGTAAGVDPFNAATGEICNTPAAMCIEHEFTATTDISIKADLGWTVPATDLDLYVTQDGAVVASSGGSPPGTSESLEAELSPGTYKVVIVPWSAAAENYKLAATFS